METLRMVAPIGAATTQPATTAATTTAEPKKAEDTKETSALGSKTEKALSLIKNFEDSFEYTSDQAVLQRASDPNPLGSGNYMPFGASSYGAGENSIIPTSLMGSANQINDPMSNFKNMLDKMSEAATEYFQWAAERYGKPDSEGGGGEEAAE